MGNLKEKVAYLQGLTQGLNVSDHSSEGKLLLNIIDVLDDMADEMQTMSLAQEDLEEYVETMDEDLTDLEEEVYEEELIDTDTDIDDDFVEVDCPVCHETVTFESEILDEDDAVEVTCPYCGGVVYDNTLEFDETDDLDDSDLIDVEATSSSSTLKHGIHPGV